MKHYLDATIKDIEILPVETLETDENGNRIKTIDPFTEKANYNLLKAKGYHIKKNKLS